MGGEIGAGAHVRHCRRGRCLGKLLLGALSLSDSLASRSLRDFLRDFVGAAHSSEATRRLDSAAFSIRTPGSPEIQRASCLLVLKHEVQ